MKNIYLHKQIHRCTEKEFETLAKFFDIKEEYVKIETKTICDQEDIHQLSTRKIFDDVKEVNNFVNFIKDSNLIRTVANGIRTGRLVAIEKSSIEGEINLDNLLIPDIIFNAKFRRLYMGTTRINPVDIETFLRMSEKDKSKYVWVFDMEWTRRGKCTPEYPLLLNDLIYIIKKNKLDFKCISKEKLMVVKANKQKQK